MEVNVTIKDGKNVDARKMQKRLDMARLKSNVGHARSEMKHEIEEAKENGKNMLKKLRKKGDILDMQENEFDLEDEHDVKKGRKH